MSLEPMHTIKSLMHMDYVVIFVILLAIIILPFLQAFVKSPDADPYKRPAKGEQAIAALCAMLDLVLKALPSFAKLGRNSIERTSLEFARVNRNIAVDKADREQREFEWKVHERAYPPPAQGRESASAPGRTWALVRTYKSRFLKRAFTN